MNRLFVGSWVTNGTRGEGNGEGGRGGEIWDTSLLLIFFSEFPWRSEQSRVKVLPAVEFKKSFVVSRYFYFWNI